MTEPQLPERDLSRALADLRDTVRRQADPPAPVSLRRWAERRRRVRRTTSALAAAAAVSAVVIGGVSVVRGDALPQPEPATSSPVTPSPSVDVSPPPTADPVPADDPITKVPWATATLTLPKHPGCPDGPVRLRPDEDWPGNASGPRGTSGPTVRIGVGAVTYGDLTGDGRAEAIFEGICLEGPEDSGDGEGQLLVVRRDSADRLVVLGWVGVRGAIYHERWVADGTLYVDVKPWYEDWGYSIAAAKGYRWDADAGFRETDVSAQFPGLVPPAGEEGVPIDLAAVADRLTCPAGAETVLRFGADGTARLGDTAWTVKQLTVPGGEPNLLDLAGDGRRRLVVALYCGAAGPEHTDTEINILVLEGSATGYRALDAIAYDGSAPVRSWGFADPTLTLYFDEGTPPLPYRWDGARFVK